MRLKAAIGLNALVLSVVSILVACSSPPPVNQQADVERASIRLSLAHAYFEEGRHAVALEEAQRSLLIDDQNPSAWVLQGLVQMALQDPMAAKTSLDQALALDARWSAAWHNRAWLFCQTGQYDEAMRDFAQAISLAKGGDRAQALLAQGVCWAQAEQWDKAEDSLARALDVDPNHPVIRYQWAKVQQARGQWASAQWALQGLNASNHVNAQSLWLAIMGAQQLGDTAAVSELVQQLQRQFPQSPQWDAYQRKASHD